MAGVAIQPISKSKSHEKMLDKLVGKTVRLSRTDKGFLLVNDDLFDEDELYARIAEADEDIKHGRVFPWEETLRKWGNV